MYFTTHLYTVVATLTVQEILALSVDDPTVGSFHFVEYDGDIPQRLLNAWGWVQTQHPNKRFVVMVEIKQTGYSYEHHFPSRQAS